MKTKFTAKNLALVSTGAALLGSVALWAAPSEGSHRGGTDILHFRVRGQMQSEGVETNASGTVEIDQNTQGGADHQQLELFARGLETNSTYWLLAATTTETNLEVVDSVSTDGHGRALIYYRDFVQGHGHAAGHRNRFPSLPAALKPVCDVRALTLANASTQAVLSADLQMPDRLDYLLKRTLTNGVVDATLWIKTTRRDADLRVLAKGLTPDSDYWLVLDGGIAQTNHTDRKGRLAAGAELIHPADILNLRTVALWDTSSNVVASTQLP